MSSQMTSLAPGSLPAATVAGSVDARYALRAPEPLATFNRAGYLRAADVHVATRLSGLVHEADPDVILALALLVRVVRDGSTCLRLETAHDLAPEVVDDPDADDGTTPDAAPVPGVPWPDPASWPARVASSPLVTAGVMRHEAGLLYLDRYWGEERSVCADLLLRRETPAPHVDEDRLAQALGRIFPGDGYAEQRRAAGTLVRSTTGVLTGGPGSGKTTTVAGFLAVLVDQLTADGSPAPRIALTAPTGKAAARLQEAVATASARFPEDARAALDGLEASTLHRLLGWRPGSRTRFRHDRANTLPHDVVVVDESSMLSLTLTARLLEALRPTTRLVLVGDADQLASVDAGAVLGDLVGGLGRGDAAARPAATEPGRDAGNGADDARNEARDGEDALGAEDSENGRGSGKGEDIAAGTGNGAPAGVSEAGGDAGSDVASMPHRNTDGVAGEGATEGPNEVASVVRLTGSHRYTGDIGELATAVRAGDEETVIRVLRTGRGMRLVDDEDPAPVIRPRLVDHAVAVREAARAGDGEAALDLLGRHRVLCAHRSGPYGVRTWNRRVEAWLTEETGDGLYDLMYVGRPLLITTNDYGLGLYNGDTGVVVAPPETGAPPVAVLAGAAGTVRMAATRLADVETMHAMTVHKAQGSEADDITVLLPPGDSALLTRELLYTAVTRARKSVTVVGSEATIRDALRRRARRASGLADRLRRG